MNQLDIAVIFQFREGRRTARGSQKIIRCEKPSFVRRLVEVLGRRRVIGVDGVQAGDAGVLDLFLIDHVFISHPDKDPDLRYYSGDSLGGYQEVENGEYFLWDRVSSNSAMHQLINQHKTTNKKYLKTLLKAVENNNNVKFTALSADDEIVDGFERR